MVSVTPFTAQFDNPAQYRGLWDGLMDFYSIPFPFLFLIPNHTMSTPIPTRKMGNRNYQYKPLSLTKYYNDRYLIQSQLPAN